MMAADGSTQSKTLCSICKNPAVKKKILCINCKQYAHVSCGKAKNCCDKVSFITDEDQFEDSEIMEYEQDVENPRKRPRSERDNGENNSGESFKEDIYDILQLVKKMSAEIATIKTDLKELTEVNCKLRAELSQNMGDKSNNSDKGTYASMVSNKNKVLIVNPKNQPETTDSNVFAESSKKMKNDIVNKLDPVDIGANLLLGKPTKKGGFIIQYVNENNSEDVQQKIQDRLVDSYNVENRNLYKNRVKILFIDESEHDNSNEVILNKIITQNGLNQEKSEMKIIFKTNLRNKKFNMSVEVNEYAYKELTQKGKIYVGWSRCPFVDDFGITRCFKCQKYGHVAEKCHSEKICCPICSLDHEAKECKSTSKKCNNCVEANNKFNLKLNVNHETWNQNCSVLKKVKESRQKKFAIVKNTEK